MNNMFASIFGESPSVAKARENRNSAFQAMLDTRRQTAEKQRTDDVRLARYNAFGNVLTTMVQPLGWAAGSTGGVQKYDDRQYISAFSRAVKAADDIRNIGTAADEYRFKLADEDYKKALAREEEARSRAFKLEEAERKYQQKLDEMDLKHRNDMEKEAAKAEARMRIAEFNAAHKITSRSSGFGIDERMKLKLIDQYGRYANEERSYGREPMKYPEWLAENGYSFTEMSTVTKPAGGGLEHADGL